jgi:glutathione S-transferase
MFATLAKIPLETTVVDLMKGEHYGPDFTKLNPNRLVPVLVDDDFVLTESSAILKYLAEKAGSPLYPKDLKQRARVNERMDWFNTNFYRDWGYNLVYPQIFAHHARATDEHTKATIEWGRDKSAAALTLLNDAILGSNKYVCGDTLTIADIFGAQFVSLGDIVRVDFTKYPNVKRWLDGMKAMEAWKQTNAVHEGFAASLAEKPLVAL